MQLVNLLVVLKSIPVFPSFVLNYLSQTAQIVRALLLKVCIVLFFENMLIKFIFRCRLPYN